MEKVELDRWRRVFPYWDRNRTPISSSKTYEYSCNLQEYAYYLCLWIWSVTARRVEDIMNLSAKLRRVKPLHLFTFSTKQKYRQGDGQCASFYPWGKAKPTRVYRTRRGQQGDKEHKEEQQDTQQKASVPQQRIQLWWHARGTLHGRESPPEAPGQKPKSQALPLFMHIYLYRSNFKIRKF
jgi:hypothetical protein